MKLFASIKRAYGSWLYVLAIWSIAALLNAGLDNLLSLNELMKKAFWFYVPATMLVSGVATGFCASAVGVSHYTKAGTRARELAGRTALAWVTAVAVVFLMAPISYLWRLLWSIPGTLPSVAGNSLAFLLLALLISLIFAPAAAGCLRTNPLRAGLASTKFVWSRVGIRVLVAVMLVGISAQLIVSGMFRWILSPHVLEIAGPVARHVVSGAIDLLIGALVFLNLCGGSHREV